MTEKILVRTVSHDAINKLLANYSGSAYTNIDYDSIMIFVPIIHNKKRFLSITGLSEKELESHSYILLKDEDEYELE